MRVLAIDTALGLCSAALWEDGRGFAFAEPMQQGHQERLAPMVAERIEDSPWTFQDIDRIAVTVGPGSFTGLRVGIAFAKGLGLALDRPVVGIDSLEALARSAPRQGPGLAVVDARRGQVYARRFEGGVPAGASGAVRLEDLAAGTAPAWIAGPGAPLLAEAFPEALIDARLGPDPLALAELAAQLEPAGHPPEPLYLRAPDAKPSTDRPASFVAGGDTSPASGGGDGVDR